MKKLLTTAAFALALAVGEAHAGGGVFIRFGPPAPRREVMVVRPGPRYVWMPGYYRWARHRYVWVRGYWTVPPRPHAVWVPGYWAPRHGAYVWISGYWR